MPIDITTLIIPALAILALSVGAWFLPPVWVNHTLRWGSTARQKSADEAEVEKLGVPWSRVVLLSSVVGFAGAAGFHAVISETVPAPLSQAIITAGGLLSFMVMMTAITDYLLYKIPKRVTQLTMLLGTVAVSAASLAAGSLMPLLVALGCMLIPFLLMFTRGIGMGDIRLYAMTAILLPWWMGIQMYVYGLIAGVIVGLLSFAIARVLKVGAQREMKPGVIDKLVHGMRRKELPEKVTKRVLPFGPAILIGFLLAAVYVIAVGEPVICAGQFYTCVAPM